MSNSMKNTFSSANGMSPFTCKKLCYFIFQDFFHSVETDREQRRFNIYLKDKVVDIHGTVEDLKTEYGDTIIWFKEFWGREFNLVILKKEEV